MIVRHDRAEAEFSIDASVFPAVCSLDEGRPRGIGTLIHPQFLLTAAHAAEKLSVGHSLTVAGAGHEVEAIHLHPTWVDRSAKDATENRLGFADLALLQLRRPVQEVDAVPLFMQQVEPGQMVTLVGNGMSGTGLTGGVQSDGKWRKATNRVEALHALYWFSMRFDEPGAGADHEGVPGVGDSGGPALIEVDGYWHLAGVASSEDSSAAPGRGRYGTTKFYVSLQAAANWIGSMLRQAVSY